MNINNIRFSKEEMKTLDSVKNEIQRAFKNNYKRNTTSSQNELVRNIMAKYGLNYTCSHCPQIVYKMYYDCGKIYKNTEQEITAELTEPIIIEQPKKKAGRPKKQRKEK